ncbi:F-box protein CPR1-like [Telopea speciosissima]|uniref:F-box protein CPR1-like n=1 Tax=Telopea speciosissima TaxID=54955 RepID=UPI001CC6C6B6|nr:F-box protein CPR1-like [Telopea speciosissima]
MEEVAVAVAAEEERAMITILKPTEVEEEKGQLIAVVPQLPQEILMDILSRLPVKTLLRFRCVSKGLRNLISDPNFITQHLNRSAEDCSRLILGTSAIKQIFYINYETFSEMLIYDFSKFSHGFSWLEIVGSSNGLLCLSFSHVSFRKKGNILYLCNPATLEIKHLPNAPIEYTGAWDYSYTAFGFGFDSIANDYKVVSIDYFQKHGMLDGTIHPSEVKVYSLTTGQWRRLEDASFNISPAQKTKLTNAVVNGAIHWMADNVKFSSEFIISFDLGLEIFRPIPEHEYRHGGRLYSKNVGVLGGCLSVFDVYCYQCIEIWVMKDYGVKDSWAKLFTIDAPSIYEFDFDSTNFPAPDSFHSLMPIAIQKNGEVLLENYYQLVSYDPKSRRERAIGSGGLPKCFRSVTYVESLVSLKVCYGQQGNLKHKGEEDESRI